MRYFTVEEARAALPELLEVAEEVIGLRAELVEAGRAHNAGAPVMALADLKAMEARMGELIDGLTERGLEVKGFAPLLVDFPALVGGQEVLLCWLEGDTSLDWYHDAELGFAGRRRLSDLED